jgi:hypothetical protein
VKTFLTFVGFLSICLAALAVRPTVSFAASKQPFSITITAVKTEVSAGAPVEIIIRQTNTSNQDVNWSAVYFNGFANDYSYDIRLEGGKKLTPLPRKDEGPVVGSAIMGTLKPGESRETRVGLGSQYDMTRPGKYIIELSRPVSAGPEKAVIKSNRITITVTKQG